MFEYINTLESYKTYIQNKSNQSDPLALDTETCVRAKYSTVGSALDCHTAEISLLILKEVHSYPVVIDLYYLRHLGYDPAPLAQILLNAECLIGANLKFDLKFLYNEFGIWYRKVFDVIIASKLIGNATGSKVSRQIGHGYGDICRELLNVHITGKKDLRVSSWALDISARSLDNEYWKEKLTYAANDVQYLFPIQSIQKDSICTPMPHTALNPTGNYSDEWGLDMTECLEREMKLVPVTSKMEYTGMPTSKKMMAAFQEGIHERLLEVGAYLCNQLGLDHPIDLGNGKQVPTDRALKKMRSSQGLLDLIQRGLNLKQFDSTQAEGLRRACDLLDAFSASEDRQATAEEIFVDTEEAELYQEFLELEESTLLQITPVVKAILEFKKLVKQDGMDLRKYINVATGRIHSSYDQLGAATSRYGSSRPNVQQQSGRTTCVISLPKEEYFT